MSQDGTAPGATQAPKFDVISYYELETRDTTGQTTMFYAAYGQHQFVLYQVDGDNTAQVFFLESAPSANDIAAVVTQKLTTVKHVRPISFEDAPTVTDAALLTSHKWSAADQDAVKVLLGTQLIH